MAAEIASPSALSLKDKDGIEMVSQRYNQIKEIRKSVENINASGEFDDIKKVADDILGQLKEGHNEIKEKKDKIEKLDQTVKQLETLPKTYFPQFMPNVK